MTDTEQHIEQVVRASYQAYVDKDRAAIEAVIAPDFHFTSPLDDRIDRAEYFRRCWPNSEQFKALDLKRIFIQGDGAYVTYEGETFAGKRFRNSEFLTVRGGQVVDVEVYFGWDIPHPKGADNR
jgi:ketosteroid isomerase-like protein